MNGNKIINVGVVGVGYLGSFHLEQYRHINDINIDVTSLTSILSLENQNSQIIFI